MSSASESSIASQLGSTIYNKEANFECRVHRCPQTLYPTFRMIFPSLASVMPSRAKLTSGEEIFDLHIVAIWQQSENDMSGFSDKTQIEREELTSKFIEWATPLVPEIQQNSNCKFVDFIEPASGLPFLTERGATIFIETDDAVSNLGYQILDFGCCKAVSHPSFGCKSFLSIIVTDAAVDKITEVLSKKLN